MRRKRLGSLFLALVVVGLLVALSFSLESENVMSVEEARTELSSLCEERAPALEVEAKDQVSIPSMKRALGIDTSGQELTQVCLLEVSDGETEPTTRLIEDVQRMETIEAEQTEKKKRFRVVYFENESTGQLEPYIITRFVRVESE